MQRANENVGYCLIWAQEKLMCIVCFFVMLESSTKLSFFANTHMSIQDLEDVPNEHYPKKNRSENLNYFLFHCIARVILQSPKFSNTHH